MASFDGEKYLKTFLNWESRLHQAASGAFLLERMERLLAVVGDPQAKLRFAHVAGTKGKGSTCAFLASILRASGYKVGLYTSPHLHSLCERIRVLGPGVSGAPSHDEGMITWPVLEDTLRYYHDGIERLRAEGVEVTFYEVITAVAMHYFATQKVDIVVLETGLGGRFDATNVFDTSVCGITSIGFDHMNILGHTLEAIAQEKAGIIKSPCQRVALASQAPEAMRVLMERCATFGIRPSVIGEDMACVVREVSSRGVVFDVQGRRHYDGLVSPLIGLHQAQNATLAIAMAEDLEMFGYVISADTLRQGIAQVAWPARFEKVADAPTVILDCAHTPESAQALAETFQVVYPGKKAVVVLGMSADKDVTAFLGALAPVTRAVVLTKADHPRAKDISKAEIGEAWAEADVVVEPSVSQAVDRARTMAGDNGIILVTGSVFVCAEVGP